MGEKSNGTGVAAANSKFGPMRPVPVVTVDGKENPPLVALRAEPVNVIAGSNETVAEPLYSSEYGDVIPAPIK